MRTSNGSTSRLVIMGVGQAMRGDDGAGTAISTGLCRSLAPEDRLLIISAGHAPENCLGPIIRFQPDVILFIDAVHGKESPGTVYWLRAQEAEITGGSTHTLSLSLLAEYLKAETGADSYILGIQPSDLLFDDGLSTPVAATVNELIETIGHHWRSIAAACSAIREGEFSVVNT